ncbi:MAG: BofC C-terminal domain-containing protein [Firmicutes bacterium]|nr:BofC C-terminal domain-containing protein [Bacillota bacterium]
MRRRKSYKLVTFCCLLFLIIGFGFGYYHDTWNDTKKEEEQLLTKQNRQLSPGQTQALESNHITAVTEAQERGAIDLPAEEDQERIDYDTKVIFKRNYLKCSHKTVEELQAPDEMINLTRETLKEHYPEWKIERFGIDEVILSTDVDEKCLKHYIVKEYNGKIGVYYQSALVENPLKQLIDINIQQLRDEDREKLKQGIYVNSDQELAQIIEDFTS